MQLLVAARAKFVNVGYSRVQVLPMSIWKNRTAPHLRAAKLIALGNDGAGANRRAVNLLPLPIARDEREISDTRSMRYRQVLLSMEAKQTNACLRIFSESDKSRSALLVYKGKVLGCIYGDKESGKQIFGREAHHKLMLDLSKPGNLVDTYVLNPELVLAAGSLFHGSRVVESGQTGVEQFIHATRMLLDSKYPGCVVISSKDDHAICMVYTFFSQIIGVFSFKDGWVEPSYESAFHYAEFTHNPKIMASALSARNRAEAEALTFSLTGLGSLSKKLRTDSILHGCDPHSLVLPDNSVISRNPPVKTLASSLFGNKS